jgi:hypothetical protein
LDPGSEIQDSGPEMDKNQDPGSGINILDPQHWFQLSKNTGIRTYFSLIDKQTFTCTYKTGWSKENNEERPQNGGNMFFIGCYLYTH